MKAGRYNPVIRETAEGRGFELSPHQSGRFRGDKDPANRDIQSRYRSAPRDCNL